MIWIKISLKNCLDNIKWGYWDLNPGPGISPASGFSPGPYRHLESPMIGQTTPYPQYIL